MMRQSSLSLGRLLLFVIATACVINTYSGDVENDNSTTEGVPSEADSGSNSPHRRLRAISEEDHKKLLESHLPMFNYSQEIYVIGPSSFPKPTDVAKSSPDDIIVPNLMPVMGQHRPDRDAVFAFAAEYRLVNYVVFVQSLRKAGFDGDIVLAVSSLDLKKDSIRKFLESPGIVVYTPDVVCFNFEMEAVDSAKGGSRVCQFHNIYARRAASPGEGGSYRVKALPDPRVPRTLQTMRYEVYWIMAKSYRPDSWLLLIDARDTVFQSNPFAEVPRKTDPTSRSGLLYFFGENIEATRLGLSKHNRKWIANAYGELVAEALKDKPTVCSGATMGEMVAMESYLQAMVAESDDTGVTLVGADQGFHNFLHYSHKLRNDEAIHDIVVFDQGTGIVNNMGALRTAPLEQWGNGRILRENKGDGTRRTDFTVLNWDGTPSPVVHQYDRHKGLSDYFYNVLGAEFTKELNI